MVNFVVYQGRHVQNSALHFGALVTMSDNEAVFRYWIVIYHLLSPHRGIGRQFF